MAFKAVFVTVITHKYGTDHYVNFTREGANQILFAYVQEWWDDYMEGIKIPKDPKKAIKAYFERSARRWRGWAIENTEFYECNQVRPGP